MNIKDLETWRNEMGGTEKDASATTWNKTSGPSLGMAHRLERRMWTVTWSCLSNGSLNDGKLLGTNDVDRHLFVP